MTRRYRIAWAALALLACYAVPHRLLEITAAHHARAAALEVAHGP